MSARNRILKFASRKKWKIANGMLRGWYPAMMRLEREGLVETYTITHADLRYMRTTYYRRTSKPEPGEPTSPLLSS